jgi:hypothetical protein
MKLAVNKFFPFMTWMKKITKETLIADAIA